MKSQILRMKRISSIVKIGTMLTLFASVMMVFLTAAGEESANGWMPPQTIVSSLPTSGWDLDEVMNDIAVDSDGRWHVIYSYVVWVEEPEQKWTYIKYVSELGDTATIAQGFKSNGSGDVLYGPSIAIDGSGTIHVTYVRYDVDTDKCSIEYTKKAGRGIVLIHGFNGSNDSWGGTDSTNLKSLLEEDGRLVKYFSYPSSNPSDWSVPINTVANWLNDSLTTWNDELHIGERGVDVIAHSMGGLIARHYIAHPEQFSFSSRVKKLVTLGTPNYGAAVALWGDLVPGTTQATQCQFGSQFLWDLHKVWKDSPLGTDVLCIAGSKDNYTDPHDGVVLLPSANLKNLNYPVCYIPNNHGGVEGMAYIEDVNHSSYVAIKSFLWGKAPQSNEESVNHLSEGMLIVGFSDPAGNAVSVGTIPPLDLPRVWWSPNPTLYWSWPWWPWLFELGFGVNEHSGKYYATGADAGSYEVDIYPIRGYSPVINHPVTIEPRQTKVLSLTVYPADESDSETFASRDTPPATFGNTGVTIDFSSGPGGSVSVYRFDNPPAGTDSVTLPHYWDIDSDFSDSSFLVSITFNYDESEVLASGLTESELKVAYYDTLWHPMTTDLDMDNNQVSVIADHFSLFAIGSFTGTSIEEEPEVATLPSSFGLSQNYPNPFNPETKIQFSLLKRSLVKINVYDIMGRRVKTLVDEELSAGRKLVTWDGKDDTGNEVATGVYFYRIKAGEFTQTRKMILLK